ncbi:hypothetical protein GQ600_12213 [Phytophthora cactorum]|nr:hypothetical protein GQ600_12213 [Phytophthora cactorum]
MQKTRY